MLYLIIAVVALSALLVWAVSGNVKKGRAIKDLKNASRKMAVVEEKKEEIRNETQKIEENIIDNPNIDHGVLPVSSKGKHNHDFRDPCLPGCPLYGRD